MRDVYIDESQRPGRYYLAAMIVDPRHVNAVRRELRLLAPRGNGVARRHFVKESTADRRKLLAAYRGLCGVEQLVYEHVDKAKPIEQRARCLDLLVAGLLGGGVARVLLDHVEDAQQKRDRHLLAHRLIGTQVSYCYSEPHNLEPMLWVPDAIAWCAGRQDWRRELDGWVTIRRA